MNYLNITNLLSLIPSLIEFICGGYYVYNPTLKRFYILHFQLSFIIYNFIIIHLYYLHFKSSNNIIRNSINIKIKFYPVIIIKDLYIFIISKNLLLISKWQTCFLLGQRKKKISFSLFSAIRTKEDIPPRR